VRYRLKHFIITLVTVLGLLCYNLLPVLSSDASVLFLFNHSQVKAQTLEEQKSEAIRRFQEAETLLNQGQSQDALEQFQEILELFRTLQEPLWEARTLNNIGIADINLGKYQRAEKQFQQVLEISSQWDDIYKLYGEGSGYTNLGTLYQELGRYSDALVYHNKALKIFKDIKDTESHSSALNNLGVVYQNLGQSEKALNHYQQALETQTNPSGKATIKSNIGSVWQAQGNYEQALALYQEALEIVEQEGNTLEKGRILNLIGSVQNQLQQPQQALYTLHRALDIRRDIQDRPGEGTTLDNFGTVYRGLAEYETALDYYNQALEIARTADAPVRPEEARVLGHIGVTLLKMGRYAEAADALTEAVNIWESLRPGLTDGNKVSLQEQQAQTYAALQEALVYQNQVEAALEISERGRARAFVELIASSLQLSEAESYQAPSPLTFSQMQEIARRQQATLVEYSYVNHGQILYIWVIQPDGRLTFRAMDVEQRIPIEIVPLATDGNAPERGESQGEPTIQSNLADAAQSIINRRKREAQIFNQQLYELLIAPIVDLLPTDPDAHVIFIPQGDLFTRAFPALQDQQGQYLIEKHTILVSPSIQVIDLTEQKRHNLTQRFDHLIVGNPKMPMIPLRPEAEPEPLAPLPGTEKEATEIAQMLNTQAILGEEATEDLMLQKMPSAQTIHLATHGLLDEISHLGLDIPGALAFTPAAEVDETTAYHNGLLTTREILDLQLDAELVVLSACNTGRGEITSDGVIGLSRAFVSAGVPSIVVSLWAIPDGPSADLMIEFYHQMQQTSDKAVALRQAMLKMMENDPDPYNWAGFLLIGQAN
jgi:CHAT domain-containing protein/Flp pilus assembly protein TadD